MNVAQILKQKGRDVLTTPRITACTKRRETLGTRRVGAIVVADATGRVLGILSERDIVRAIGAHGAEALPNPSPSI